MSAGGRPLRAVEYCSKVLRGADTVAGMEVVVKGDKLWISPGAS